MAASRDEDFGDCTGEVLGVQSGERVGMRLGAPREDSECEEMGLRIEASECGSEKDGAAARYGWNPPLAELVLCSERSDTRLRSELALTLEAPSSLSLLCPPLSPPPYSEPPFSPA